MPNLRVTSAFAVTLIATCLAVWGQSVRWEPPAGSLAYNQTTELQLIFENCEPKDDPAVPAVAGLQLQTVGQSSNMSIVNGRVSQTVAVTFHARATQKNPITIPTFSVNTNKGRLSVPAVSYTVGDATVGQASVSLDRVANSQIKIPGQVWAGEVFPIEYSMNVARRYLHSPGTPTPEWNPAPIAMEDWAKPELQESVVSGEQRVMIVYRSRGSVKAPGEFTLNSASQLINLTTGTASFGFFSRPNLEQYAITSDRPALTVRPLPVPAPASFNGAVGHFKFESKVIPASATVGEPITWTLTITGTGNWPEIQGLPGRDVSRDFRIVQPQARRSIKEGALFEGSLSEDVVLIPTQAGNYTLGPVAWTYFDPTTGTYKTLSTEATPVAVVAPAAPASPSSAPSAAQTSAPAVGSQRNDPANLKPPALPQPIPRDALAGRATAPVPWTQRTLAAWLIAPLSIVLVVWVALACARARATDPFRSRREALARLRSSIAALKQSQDPLRRRSLLQAWQSDAAVVCGLRQAVPKAQDFAGAISGSRAKHADQWTQLWREADRALYSADGALPPDWAQRADALAADTPVPRFSVLQLFRPRNLLPFAAAALLAISLTSSVKADDAVTAYQRGDFGTAEKTWRAASKSSPTDWVARHNLALSLAQQNRWGEASAYAVSAFVQHPRDPSVRWHLTLTAERAGFAPGSLSGFVAPAGLHSLARLCSPAEWQRVLVCCVAMAALAGSLFLLVGYRRVSRWTGLFATLLLIGAFFTAIGATIGYSQYDNAADARAALVWKPAILRSIPTEADTTQKTSPLAAGTIAVVDKQFLGWSRLVFTNGQTGWVRQDDLVPLWR